ARRQLTQTILLRSALRLAMMIAGAAAIVWIAVTVSLRPLYRLGDAIAERSPNDLHPIEQRVPSEVQGLVDTVNSFMVRLESALDALRHFTGNASHQLRTPLAIVRTQLALASRATDMKTVKDAVGKADAAVADSERLLGQLLLMAKIDAATRSMSLRKTDLSALAQALTADHIPMAAEAGIDLGFEGDDGDGIAADPRLLGGLLTNLTPH